jgi:transcriptional regulator with XRE-family HTH domain
MEHSEKVKQLIRQAETGDFLIKARNEMGLSLDKVGERLGVSKNTLSVLERGLKVPSDRLLRQISDFYGIEEPVLFGMLGKVPLTAREELENNNTLQRILYEIGKSPLTEKQKSEVYDAMYKLFKNIT